MYYVFKAIRGNEWGRVTYVAQIPFTEIQSIARIDEYVQREANKNRMEEISAYILNAFKDAKFNAGFNSLVTSLRNSDILYDEEKNEIKLSTRAELYLCDGQHRYGGIIRAIKKVEDNIKNSRDDNEKQKHKNIYNLLKNNTIPVVIFTDLNIDEEKQLFSDLNKLGVNVDKTTALSRDSNDIYNRIAKELSTEIEYIKKYGIDQKSQRLQSNNRAIATLSTWNLCIRILINGYSNINNSWNSIWSYEEKKKMCFDFWDEFFRILPKEFTNKKKYMVTNAYYLQGIAQFGYKIMQLNTGEFKNKLAKLKNFNWENTNKIYAKCNGAYLKRDKKSYSFNGTSSAVNSVSNLLKEHIS